MAVVSELNKQSDEALHFYRAVSQVDSGYATALFGQARLLASLGKTDEAVAALALVPANSSLYVEAQKELAMVLIYGNNGAKAGSQASSEALNRAAQTIEALVLTGAEKLVMVKELCIAALQFVSAKQGTLKLLDKEVAEVEVRARLEAAYRDLARLAHEEGERIRLVDLANSSRPRTTF